MSRRRVTISTFAVALSVALVMVVGVLGLGRLAGSDLQAIALTSVFFVVMAVAITLVIRRRRDLTIALGAPFLAVAGVAGIWLGLPLVTDRAVDEQVAAATSRGSPAQESKEPARSDNVLLATGQFEAASHPGSGTASLIALEGGGSGVVTLTDFETDNGPDLLLYLVPADAPAGSADGAVSLGALKGNRGDQQYEVPAGTDLGAGWRVVVWCRAFAVSFTEANLVA